MLEPMEVDSDAEVEVDAPEFWCAECKIPLSRTQKILRRHEKEKHKKVDKAGVTLLVPVCFWCR